MSYIIFSCFRCFEHFRGIWIIPTLLTSAHRYANIKIIFNSKEKGWMLVVLIFEIIWTTSHTWTPSPIDSHSLKSTVIPKIMVRINYLGCLFVKPIWQQKYLFIYTFWKTDSYLITYQSSRKLVRYLTNKV